MNYRLLAVTCGLLPMAANAQFISVEKYASGYQTDASTVTVDGYYFKASIDSDVAGASSATVSAGSGVLTTPAPLTSVNGELQYVSSKYASGSALSTTSDYPNSTTYTVRINNTTDVAIPGPGPSTFSSYLPNQVQFSISGVTGTWSTYFDSFLGANVGVFTFDPTGVTSFTVSTNTFSVATAGDAHVTDLTVWRTSGSVLFDSADQFNPLSQSVTFYTTGHSGDVLIAPGDSFDIEGTFSNGYGVGAAEYGTGNQKAFVESTKTYFQIQASAIPEPSTYALLIGFYALANAATCRRRRA